MSEPKTLTVTARRAGFRRAGREWPAEPVTARIGDFSEAQWAQLAGALDPAADPDLIVVEGAAGPEAAEPGGGREDPRERLVRLAAVHLPPSPSGGPPTVAAMKKATGLRDVSAAERDAHLAEREAEWASRETPPAG